MFKYIIAFLLLAFPVSIFAQNKIIETQFNVAGVCGQCKDRIESTVSAMGAKSVNWDVDSHILTVKFDSSKISETKIKKKLADVGHDTDLFKASDKNYSALPDCCLYRAADIDALHPTISTAPSIRGIVFEENTKGNLLPAFKASIQNLETGDIVVTDSLGLFLLPGTFPARISISYVGHKKDSVTLQKANLVQITLKKSANSNLEQVVVVAKNNNTYISNLSTLNTTNMGLKELAKAACCNLSESFETNPAVDVSYSDAITGIKQIKLLGLSGKYAQITTENVPSIRGLNGSYGLTFIPGPWIEGIQLTKGTGSVVNGYESIAGQINIELVKPNEAEKLYVNGFANNMGRAEASVNFAQRLNHKWSTSLLTHYNNSFIKNDDNKDGFLDAPTGNQINIINKWMFQGTNGIIFHLDLKALKDKRQGGEVDFNEKTDKLTTNHYGLGLNVDQYEATAKLGYLFPGKKFKSIGLMVSAKNFTNDAYYGINKYDAENNSIYANIIYQDIILNTFHKYRTGVSFLQDNYKEGFATNNYDRKETVPGAFFEYTYTPGKKFSVIAGYRFDYHNEYGAIHTPRLHVKYDVTKNTSVRLTAGSGFKVANIFAENIGWFASSRAYSITNPTSSYGYGLAPEKAWNFGLSILQKFKVNNKPATFSLDAYHTNFKNQVVTDIDFNKDQIVFYNLANRSYSNSVQAELNIEPIKKLELRFAYRYIKAITKYNYAALEEPLTAPHRLFLNAGYEIPKSWRFDYTVQWISEKRLPNSSSDVMDKRLQDYSKSYVQMNTQVTKIFSKKWEVYAGAENLTNFTQKMVVQNANTPFAPGFDAAVLWGPISGRTLYAGFRFRLP